MTRNDRLDCWDPERHASFQDVALPRCEEGERDQTGACPEAQADGVPCVSPARQCELCGRAHSGKNGGASCPSTS